MSVKNLSVKNLVSRYENPTAYKQKPYSKNFQAKGSVSTLASLIDKKISSSHLIKPPPTPGMFDAIISSEVTDKYVKLVAPIDKEVVYYILGPVTDYDRAFIKKILDNGKKIHVFIQGGIETTRDKIWSTTLLGAVPANAGMDFESFYNFFENEHNENMKVYVQFTNMAKGVATDGLLGKLWVGEEMKQFLKDLEMIEGGTMFAKIWETYFKSAGAAAAWQHDPIEVINSLFQLSENEYTSIVDKGRYVTYDRNQNKNGLISPGPPPTIETRETGDKRVFAKLLDHDLGHEDYMKAQELRFKQFIRLLRQSFGLEEQVMPSPIIVPENKLQPLFSNIKGGGEVSALNNTDLYHNKFVDDMIAAYKQKYLPFISIEILDPDNNFAAKLIDHISGGTAHVFVHSQFYPVNVRSFAGIPDPDKKIKMINMMNVPMELLTDEIMANVNTTVDEAFYSRKIEVLGKPNYIKTYADVMKIKGSGFPPPQEALMLLCGKTFGENKNKYIDCAAAEINFMKILLNHNRVYLGQPLYGYKDTDFTFTSRGLLHPVSLFNCEKFTEKGKSDVFVNDVFEKVSGTAFEHTDKGLVENYRTECLDSWTKSKAVPEATVKIGGRKSKKARSRRSKRKTRKSRSRR